MDRPPAFALQEFAIRHARVAGPGASGGGRTAIEDLFAGLAPGDVVGPGEVLFVPRLRAGLARTTAARDRLRRRLIAARDAAVCDPAPDAPFDRPLRFSSHAVFAAWLVSAVLQRPAAQGDALAASLVGEPSAAAWWRRAILLHGTALVATIAGLAAQGQAAKWIARLAPQDLALAGLALERDYGLPLFEAGGPASRSEVRQAAPPAHSRIAGTAAAVTVHRAVVALADQATVIESLAPPARYLLLAAVVLARNPALPRVQLATALAAAVAGPAAAAEGRTIPGAVDEPAPPVSTDQSLQVHAPPPPVAAQGGPLARRELAAIDATPAPWQREMPGPAGAMPSPALMDRDDRRAVPVLPAREAEPSPAGAPAALHRSSGLSAQPDDAADLTSAEGFDTRFGGIAFLLNAFIAMDFYPDFSRPMDRGLEIAPLALADALALRRFGAAYRRDPLHRWIRERGEPGALPRRWSVPRHWLAPFPAAPASHRGKTLWHAAGFPLASRVGPCAALRQARALGLRLAARGAAVPACDPDWLDCLALFLDARLARASAGCGIGWQDLALPARCSLEEEKMIFAFPLDRLPLAIRLAGLDRDIGWLPAEGRDIRFRFA